MIPHLRTTLPLLVGAALGFGRLEARYTDSGMQLEGRWAHLWAQVYPRLVWWLYDGFAEALELHTTAEGVETEAQRLWLQRQGFHWGQGYLLAKPMPLQETLNLLLTHQGVAVPL